MSQLSLINYLARRFLPSIRPAFVASWLKRLLGVSRTVVETEFGRFYIDPTTRLGVELTRNGEYEPSMIQTLREHLPESGTFVDIGANEGFFSVLAAQMVGPEGSVVSIEPQERLQPVLRRNISLNGNRNVKVHRLAISDRKGTETLHLTPDVNSGASGLKKATWYPSDTENVPTTTLKNFLNGKGLSMLT